MSLFSEARERLRSLFFRERQDRELDEEVRSHLAMEIEANLQKGMDPAEARRRAAITFGAIERVKEEVRDARSLGLAEDLIRDLKYAIRRLSLAAVGILTGLGCALATSQLLRGLLYGVGPTDPATLAGACGALLIVSIFSSWIPARRAAAVPPAQSLS